ncbi:MAG: hypothetical protein N2482_02395 [Patescibacteria group bacterium]|nr:hypothetical protein [Patescibacteria group bacterium]
MPKIKKIFAQEVLNGFGLPTIKGYLLMDNEVIVETSVASPWLTNKDEMMELRDNDNEKRLIGMGVSKAVYYLNNLIAPKLRGVSLDKQKEIDYWLIKADATKNKSKLGVNTILTISQLVAKAGAKANNLPLFRYLNSWYKNNFNDNISLDKIPTPIFSIIHGGKYNHNLNFQDFLIIFSSIYQFEQSYYLAVEFFFQIKKAIEKYSNQTFFSQFGSYAPTLSTNIDGLEILKQTSEQLNLKPGLDIFFGLDIAADYFYKNGLYHFKDKNRPLNTDDYIKYLLELTKNYSFLFLEDPLSFSDWNGWSKLYSLLAKEIYLAADDLTLSNKEKVLKAIKNQSCTTILIKLSQLGTITETMELINLLRKNNLNYVIASRSQETEDDFIADLAIAVQSEFVKFGPPLHSEFVVKYNRLLEIEKNELHQ